MRVALFAALLLVGCSGAAPPPGEPSPNLQGADDSVETCEDGITGSVPIGSTLRTTADVNFRKGPSTSYGVYRVLPEGTEVTSVNSTGSTNHFYNVEHQGIQGWVHGKYMAVVSVPGQEDPPPKDSVDRQMVTQIAHASVGFSYWWGHGRFRMEGPTVATAGSCAGSCPNCTHSGQYGADCSGMVAKAWGVPGNNSIVSIDSHPYSTVDFNQDSSQWYTVPRSSLLEADGLVYNSGGSGHVVVYEKGEGWGDMWLYECRGCAAGCVHNLRSLSSSYHGIRRQGL